MTPNEELMQTWCDMWSVDPTIAHDVLAEGGLQWSGQTAGLDTVVGPDEQVAFVTAYRAEHPNVFTPRVLADAGDTFAYVWEVQTPDGGRRTGFDANVVHDGKVTENWTFVGDLCTTWPPEGGPGDPAELAAFARAWLGDRQLHRDLVVDAGRGRVAMLHSQGGSLLQVADGAVTWEWTVPTSRPYSY